ncbi:hypothetical protein ARAM_000202 [Aspergillus rambellii]|uniref:Cytochrome P450 n=1 Tax=Aspergillus rambellii TaxID=308745 RepID=A0A0F8W7V5_9EURO|nr:hypothetical protein ARAM_000202 [Aspergillus rambellii]
MTPLIVYTLLMIVSYLVYHRLRSQWHPRLPFPPGPPAEPILGHLRIIPHNHPEYQYARWSREYNSDILYFTVLGRPMIVINSIEAAHDLLDKENYADRPRFVLFEVMGWGITLSFLRWSSPRFKLHRRLLQQSFTPSSCKPYRPIQQEEARRAIRAILRQPNDWELLLRQFSTAVVLRIGFGIPIQQHSDPYVQMAIDVEEATGKGGVPASSIVDFFPLFRFLPTWVAKVSTLFEPLAHARRTRPFIQQLHDKPWEATEPSIRAGTATQPSFMLTHFGRYLSNEANGRNNEATIADLKGAAGAVSIAGGNTTWSTIIVCILNLMLHPEIQRRAREEIDLVVGVDDAGGPVRLPTFDDRPQLKFLEYILLETTRWAPLSPVGVPHATMADDTYKGYYIPKGAVVYANAWAMTHDGRHYSTPDEFDPDRYLPLSEGGKGEPLPEGPFGFGRRICPGQHLALAGVYIAMATLLATMELKCPLDEKGMELKPEVSFTNGLSGVPDTFQCVMRPRSERITKLL